MVLAGPEKDGGLEPPFALNVLMEDDRAESKAAP